MKPFSQPRTALVAMWVFLACTGPHGFVLGQPPAAEPPAAESNRETSLAEKQDAIAVRFKRFENTLLQMAEYMRKTDPECADLLVRAIGRSKQDRIGYQMERIVALLESERLGDANDRQNDLVGSLHNLLDLLQSEDRRSEIEKEKERLKDLVKNLDRLIGKEKDVRVGTERGGDAAELAEKQDKIAGETGKLVEKIDEQDAEKRAEDAESQGDGKPSQSDDSSQSGTPKDSEQGQPDDDTQDDSKDPQADDSAGDKDGEDKDQQNSDGSQNDGERKDGDSEQKDGESQPNESGQEDSGQQQSGQQQSGQQQSGQQQSGQQQSGQQQSGQQQSGQQQQQKQTPGRDDIEKARQQMKKAVEELKRLDREQAEENQDEAIQKLVEAKEKLEEILRQLREEEQKLILAALEARFNKMLAMQLVVYHETVRLGNVDKEKRTDRHRAKSRELAFQEEAIALEANKALALLKEEGSSVAFPEAVEQIRDDMQLIARRLERMQVDELTQEIEKSVIESLEEMVEALQKEMEKSDEERQQQQQQQGQPQPPPLVDVLSELKMLRSLQLRINRRTRRLGRLIDGEQATETDVLQQLRELSRRQLRLQDITHDLVTGKNR